MRTTTILIGILFCFSAKGNAQLGSGWDWASISTVATYSPGRQVIDIATDNQQNVYAVGRFQGSLTLGGFTVATSGDGTVNFNFDEDAFVVKYNASGEVQWLKKYGIAAIGSNQVGQVIAVDASGNVYIGGSGLVGSTIHNAFLVKYDPNGNVLWSKTDFEFYEINGINFVPDGNMIVMESNQGGKNIYKMNPADGSILWTVVNTGAGSNSTTTYQDFTDTSGNVYYTCFTSAAGTANIAGQSQTTTGLATFIASVDTNGITHWVQQIDNVQVQLGYTIDADGKSYIQIGGGFGGTFQGISTAFGVGYRYLELDNNGTLTRYLAQSPYKGLFRVKEDAIYGFTTEQSGFAATLTYGTYNFELTTDNTKALGIAIKYDKATDAVTWANAFTMVGDAFNSGKLLTIETGSNGKIIVGGLHKTAVIFGSNTFSTTAFTGNSPRDLFIAQGNSATLGTVSFDTDSMVLYPNPARDLIHFRAAQTPTDIMVYNVFGQLVIQKSITGDSIDVSGLCKGTYLVKTIDGQGRIQQVKFLKQ